VEIVGYLSSFFLAVCGAPTAYLSIKNGNSHHIDVGLFTIWYAGDVLGLIYVSWLLNLPLIMNYGFNFIILTIIGYYKLYPRSNDV
jgi:uncharacterized protein with PQ loop repeat